jgi:hypothetical protein
MYDDGSMQIPDKTEILHYHTTNKRTARNAGARDMVAGESSSEKIKRTKQRPPTTISRARNAIKQKERTS